MNTATTYSIGELADAAGTSRRAVRFYVMRGLLEPPLGQGRGSYYTAEHLEKLQRILQWQQAGHRLDDIALLQSGQPVSPPSSVQAKRPPAQPRLSASLWTHVHLAEGIELQIDTRRHEVTAEQLLAVRQVIHQYLNLS